MQEIFIETEQAIGIALRCNISLTSMKQYAVQKIKCIWGKNYFLIIRKYKNLIHKKATSEYIIVKQKAIPKRLNSTTLISFIINNKQRTTNTTLHIVNIVNCPINALKALLFFFNRAITLWSESEIISVSTVVNKAIKIVTIVRIDVNRSL